MWETLLPLLQEYGLWFILFILLLDRMFPKGFLQPFFQGVFSKFKAKSEIFTERSKQEAEHNKSIIDQALEDNRDASSWLRNVVSNDLKSTTENIKNAVDRLIELRADADVLLRDMSGISDLIIEQKETMRYIVDEKFDAVLDAVNSINNRIVALEKDVEKLK